LLVSQGTSYQIWVKSEKQANTQQSYVDHVWISTDLYTRGCILGSAIIREQAAG
jgi:hypothetical protein